MTPFLILRTSGSSQVVNHRTSSYLAARRSRRRGLVAMPIVLPAGLICDCFCCNDSHWEPAPMCGVKTIHS